VLHRKLFLIAVAFTAMPAALPAQGQFGSAVAVSGREVYVGQPGNVYGPGAVYVFRADPQGVWRVATKLTRSGATNGDGFGSAIAADGNTLLVGQTKADSESGLVVVLTRDGAGAWRETGTLKAPERHAGDAFGASIVVSGGGGGGGGGGRAFIPTGVPDFGPMVFTRRGGWV